MHWIDLLSELTELHSHLTPNSLIHRPDGDTNRVHWVPIDLALKQLLESVSLHYHFRRFQNILTPTLVEMRGLVP